MRPFLDEDFLLDTQTARALYHGVAEGMPILDYHCHVSPREIAEDRVFRNLTQLCVGAAHHRVCARRGKIPGLGRHLRAVGGQSPLSLEPFGAQAIFRL